MGLVGVGRSKGLENVDCVFVSLISSMSLIYVGEENESFSEGIITKEKNFESILLQHFSSFDRELGGGLNRFQLTV